MYDFNQLIMIGRLTRDIKTFTSKNGDSAVSFTLANNPTKEDSGTTFYDCIIWNEKLADFATKFLKKGSQIVVTGPLTTRKWEKDGKYGTSLEVTVLSLSFTSSGKKKEDSDTTSNSSSTSEDDGIPY